jgi:hypothetical protein
VIIGFCILFAIALFAYIFAPEVTFERATDKPRLVYLEERKATFYENLRDLNFDYNAGKYPAEDFESLRSSLEAEAAGILAEIAALQGDEFVAGCSARGGAPVPKEKGNSFVCSKKR